MSVIKQISVFDGNSWNTGNIGADASNIDISSSILGSSTNVQSALTTIGNKIGTTAIPSGLGTTLTGAINTLNTNLNSFNVYTVKEIILTQKTIASQSAGTWTYKLSSQDIPNGYNKIFIIIPSTSGSYNCYFYNCYAWQETGIYVQVKNATSTQVTVTPRIKCIFSKN